MTRIFLAFALLFSALSPAAAGVDPVARGLAATAPRTVCQKGVQVSHTGDTAEFTLDTCTIPANALGANGVACAEAVFTYTNNADTKTPRIRFAGNQIISATGGAQAGQSWRVCIANQGATNSQITSNLAAAFGSLSVVPITTVVDTTQAQTITFTGQLGTSTDTIALVRDQVVIYPHN